VSGGGGAQLGGVNEWSSKFTTLGCVGLMSVLMIGAAFAVAVGGLVYVYEDVPEKACVGQLAGISFSYIMWLKVMGWTFVGSTMLELIFIFMHGHSGTVCTAKLAQGFAVLWYAFQAAWLGVGAALYWNTVSPNCNKNSKLQALGLAIFIIQSLVILCLFLGRKAAQIAANTA
jgi:hypothetical protein